MKRRTPPTELTEAFRQHALDSYRDGEAGVPELAMRLFDGGPACWLYQFDELERPCSGRLEAIHLLSRQRIRNILRPLLLDLPFDHDPLTREEVDDIVELAEWDPRNSGSGCTGHHRRVDSQATPKIEIPVSSLRFETVEFVTGWGFESEAERRFAGPLPVVGAAAGIEQPQQAAA